MPKKRGPKLQTPRKTTSEPRGIVAFAIFFGLTAIAYWPALQGALLWDDERHVTRPDLQSFHGLWRI